MFSIGIVAGGARSPVFLINGRIAPAGGLSEINLNTNGTTSGSGIGVSGYGWYRGAPINNVGLAYESRGVLEVGIGLGTAGAGSINTWRQISSQARWYFDANEGAYGRVRLEIRDRVTLQVLATGRYWTSAEFAP